MPSIVANILDVAETRLANTVGVTDVYRRTRMGRNVEVKDKAILLSHDEIESSEELSAPGNPPKTAWNLPVRVTCLISPSESDQTPIDELASNFVIEAMRAITTPDDTWHQFGGNAINATLGPPQTVDSGDETVFAVFFVVTVTYRVDETDQDTLAG